MTMQRRDFIKGIGGALMLPLLESSNVFAAGVNSGPPVRFLCVGNPLGMHPDSFFPKTFGKDFTMSRTLQSLEWLKDRMTVVSHTDHGMVGGHGREVSFLNGIMPEDASTFAEKNITLDQMMARHSAKDVRHPSIEAALDDSIRMNWTANGVEKIPFTDPQKLYNHLFKIRTASERKAQRELLERDGSILDSMTDQFAHLRRTVSKTDWERLDQYQTSIRELEETFVNRLEWVDKDPPGYDISKHFKGQDITVEDRYNAIFDMIGYAFETDQTRVASIGFPQRVRYTELDGINRSYHACTHNGKVGELINELVAIESFQIQQLSRCLKRLDAIKEPRGNGTMLDNTIVLFGSGMGYGGTHSNRKLPVFVAGGGFQHLGHVDARKHGRNLPLCNLYVTLLNRFGIKVDRFNTSTSNFELKYNA